MRNQVKICDQVNNSNPESTSAERHLYALQQLSSIHGKETFAKLKDSLYNAIFEFVQSEIPLEGERLNTVHDLHELHMFCDKLIGVEL